MDPQQRLFLTTTWHLLERSGVTQAALDERYGRRVGVYVGASSQLYRSEALDAASTALTGTASYNLIANRVSHFFGLEGPSLAVDSMCTSAAMAIHLACNDLLRGEAELAIAGGVNLAIHPDKYVALAQMGLLGSERGSRSYRAGDGYLPAEGVGAVLLKPLDAAVRDGDELLAVIRGTASCHSGRAKGFMTPSYRVRVATMRRALAQAQIEPADISYVEDAADGSTLTDEVGISALRELFRGVDEPVVVGTVKSNLGHPEAASGIAQLTKVVLQLAHEELAPLVEVGSPNPQLGLDGSGLELCTQLRPWRPRGSGQGPRRALINSVAAGGSHVSLVIEEPPAAPVQVASPAAARPQLVVLSAKRPSGLRLAAQRLHDYVATSVDHELADLAYTTQLGREALRERLAVVAGSVVELREALAAYLAASESGVAMDVAMVHVGSIDDERGQLAGLLRGSRAEEFLSGLIADGELERLAELWVCGVELAWARLHPRRRRLVSLPLTAFEERRCWLGEAPTLDAEASAQLPAEQAGSGLATGSRRVGRRLTSSEQAMAAAWAEVLQVEAEELGARSSFFDLGGGSLLAVRLTNLLEQRFGTKLPIEAVFNAPRLAEMAAILEHHGLAPDGRSQLDMIIESLELIEGASDEQLEALEQGGRRS
ncbi:Malonyl CoA-acyl carrier protein transacylase [Enhygromyxa salina]|uniref:Malonyl CoA-acyl carrier protein transacylase n=2 Tax=Enhygromyxa salina TaxID=215803 RepID=A0A0C1Z2N6_9BACT|nr:Malonyl CoA-acyl carrier protein transacylase [Enhygromyxa salina]